MELLGHNIGDIVALLADICVSVVEAIGLVVIVGITIHSLIIACGGLLKRLKGGVVFRDVRLRLTRGILLGLELLVAADIIRTIAIDMTFKSIGGLALIIAIRTFLNFTLEVEMTGHWPWQQKGRLSGPKPPQETSANG